MPCVPGLTSVGGMGCERRPLLASSAFLGSGSANGLARGLLFWEVLAVLLDIVDPSLKADQRDLTGPRRRL